jgi:hypothetical protein
VPGFVLKRDAAGKLRFRAFGCCDTVSLERMYARAFLVQELKAGGRLTGWDAEAVELTDRKGRLHRVTAA